ncbi:shikimate 5-dehydrogenase [Mycobacterium sp. 852013-50091_SCH5140682]|uniref:shikimate 5-dehydrogenase n=1 Tax=Mycobacterium sp. 852013-50091_SCH5140682 TaxID=1834109 RepID=UPI0007E925ED|nr:shikimate 5-dehydrogenase [Mycobacterium sp. 852013-50091_SCH5140682]OBC10830.1 shikimate 5-dehydrogenase [Mycobacterium sp. 852013-50091_SCH5140682]
MNVIDRDTVMCMSLAARPGNHGNRFHNYLYSELGLNYIYKSFSSSNIGDTIAGIRSLDIRGVGVSMPYKESVIPFLDQLDASAQAIESVNTIVNNKGVLTGYNTDFIAVRLLLDQFEIPTHTPFALLGAGGMAKAVLAALRDAGFTEGIVVAPRNLARGSKLAARYDVRAGADLAGTRPRLLLNATPVGMSGGPEADQMAFASDIVAEAEYVFDAVYMPRDTPLVCEAKQFGKRVITGDQVMLHQASEQFVLYTGIRPSRAQLEAAETYAAAT